MALQKPGFIIIYVWECLPLGEGVRGPDHGRMRENLPEISRKWVLTERFALISRLRAAASPEGEALGGYYYALPHFK